MHLLKYDMCVISVDLSMMEYFFKAIEYYYKFIADIVDVRKGKYAVCDVFFLIRNFEDQQIPSPLHLWNIIDHFSST